MRFNTRGQLQDETQRKTEIQSYINFIYESIQNFRNQTYLIADSILRA